MYNKIIYYLKRFNYQKLIVPSIFIVVYILSFILMYYKLNKKINIYENKDEVSIKSISLNEEEVIDYIYVDIKGEIENPGVYKLESGSRVNDLINSSGGLKSDANTRFINLSKELKDGDAIVVYSNSEIEEAKESNTIIVETPCVCEQVENDACIKETKEETSNNNSFIIENINNKININTASIEELKTINGIGDSKAKAIIEYRTNNGLFKSIEDITKVSGISESIYTKIKENITV